ncbi:MAG: hypothetical protein ACPGVT_10715 [Maricaulaceae bacterium]
MKNLFFTVRGCISQKVFCLGVVGLFVFVTAMNALLRYLDNNNAAFIIALFFPFLALYMIYAVYGKRLHDMGRSVWAVTGAVFFEFLTCIGVMLAFGGAEYFAAFSQYERKAVIEEDVRQALIVEYQTEMAAQQDVINILLLIIPVALTLWLIIGKPKTEDNPYRM